MIRVYNSVDSVSHIEEYGDVDIDVRSFLTRLIKHYDHSKNKLIVRVNGKSLPHELYDKFIIRERHDIDIYPRPLDDVFNVANTVFFSPITWLFNQLIEYPEPDVPDSPAARLKGKQVSASSTSNDYAKIGNPIPVIFGSPITSPLLIAASYNEYVQPTVLQKTMVMLISEHDVVVEDDEIYIGGTSITEFDSYSDCTIRGPGESISDPYYYVIPEVGATTNNSQGILLNSIDESDIGVSSVIITNNQYHEMDIPIPAAWFNGTITKIFIQVDATASGLVNSRTSFIFNAYVSGYRIFDGMEVTVLINDSEYDLVIHEYFNDYSSEYVTFSYINGDPFAEFTGVGTVRLDIRNRGAKHRIQNINRTANTFTVQTLLEDNTLDLDPNVWENGTYNSPYVHYQATAEGSPGAWKGPFAACLRGDVTNQVSFNIYFSDGLGEYDESTGILGSHTVDLVFGYSVDGGNTWTESTYTYTDATADSFGDTIFVPITNPNLNPILIRLRKTTANGGQYHLDKVVWQEAKSLMGTVSSYPGYTAKVTIKSGLDISYASENNITMRVGRVYDGDSVPDDSIHKAFYSVLADLGISTTATDTDHMGDLDSLWTSRSDVFNYEMASNLSAADQLNTILRAGMAELKMSSGLISAVREGVFSGVPKMVTPHDIKKPVNTSFKTKADGRITGVDVNYVEYESWVQKTVKCRIGGVTADKIETITVNGVTDETRAWRIGMRKLRKHLYSHYTHSFISEMSMYDVDYKDVVLVFDDMPGSTVSRFVVDTYVDGSNTILVLDYDVDISGYSSPKMVMRDHEGLAGDEIDIISATGNEVTILTSDVTASEIIVDGSILEIRVSIYDTNMPGWYMMANEIKNSGDDNSITVTGEQYSADFYADDDNQP